MKQSGSVDGPPQDSSSDLPAGTTPSSSSRSKGERILADASTGYHGVHDEEHVCPGCKPNLEDFCSCPHPTPGAAPRRNLIVCIDGTAQQIGAFNTHVVELYSMLENSDRQLTYYTSGVGSYVAGARPLGRVVQKIVYGVDIAFALRHEVNILRSYKWICDNYTPGDRIFIFGFSRGAYQARVISELIECIGILRRNVTNQISFAFRRYLLMKQAILDKLKNPDRESESDETRADCEQFKRLLSHSYARVHFLGAWDTVTSIGLTQGPRFVLPGMMHVCACRHALGLHERRVKYGPEYFQSGIGSLASAGGNVREVWFAGCHSDIGGGYLKSTDANHGGPALRWMVYEAMEYGLFVQPFQRQWGSVTCHPSMVGLWGILEAMPFKRLSYDSENYNATTHWPHFSAGRRIQKGQLIHTSVQEYYQDTKEVAPESKVISKATLLLEKKWIPFEKYIRKIDLDMLEKDSHHDVVKGAISSLRNAVEAQKVPDDIFEQLSMLDRLLSCTVGRQSLIDSLHNEDDTHTLLKALVLIIRPSSSDDTTAQNTDIKQANRNIIAHSLSKVLASYHSRPNSKATTATAGDTIISPRQSAAELWGNLSFANDELRDKVLRVFCSDTLPGRSSVVHGVSWSPCRELERIASASHDSSIQIWDVNSLRSISGPLFGHDLCASSIAFSGDGKQLISGSHDKIVHIWDTKRLRLHGGRQPQMAHDSAVRTVAFSPRSNLIASGSNDPTIRVESWDPEANLKSANYPQKQQLGEHAGGVWSVAFSPEGTHLASGSGDNKLRVWSVNPPQTVPELEVEAHSKTVSSVVFSPDGKYVISGSLDGTVEIWNRETKSAVKSLRLDEHRGEVTDLAVSSHSSYATGEYMLASASSDSRVRLWKIGANGQTRTFVASLKGHSQKVHSISFSPDGTRIAAGSDGGVLMIWQIYDSVPRAADKGKAS